MSQDVEHHFPEFSDVKVSEHGLALVESLRSRELDSNTTSTHLFCIFVIDPTPELFRKFTLSAVIQNLLSEQMLYHTIRHPVPRGMVKKRDILWNLPLPYRPADDLQRDEFGRWIVELSDGKTRDHSFIAFPSGFVRDHWSNLQLLLLYLRQGHSLEDANELLSLVCQESRCTREDIYGDLDKALNEKCRHLKLLANDFHYGDVICRGRPSPEKVPTKGSRLYLQWLEDLAQKPSF